MFLLSSFSLISHWILGGRIKIENEAVHVQTLLAEIEHRARRNRIPSEHRERIVRAFEDPHGLPFGGRHVRGEPQHS